MKLTNFPEDTFFNTYTYSYWDGIFSKDECENIIKTHNNNMIDGLVGNNDKDSNFRKSKINFNFLNQNNGWIFDKLFYSTDLINNRFYQYDLIGFKSYQYTTYQTEDYFDRHIDMKFGESNHDFSYNLIPRKLSFVLVLNDKNDYTGGDLQIETGAEPQTLEPVIGRIYAFPSFMLHRVTPIESGSRKSIVWWAVGPKFR